MKVDNIQNLPKIPMLRTPVIVGMDIAGHKVFVHKPKARQAAIVATRLMESFGETMLAIFASPAEDLEAAGVVGDSELERGESMLKNFLAGGMMPRVAARLRELEETQGPDHLAWYFENLLVGNVELDGYVFRSLDEFDQAQFSIRELMEVLWKAVELCIYPTSGDPSIGAGKSEAQPRQATQQEPGQAARHGKKRKGGTSKGGQSVRMSASSG
jgi:hypothetical protein